MSSSSLFQDCQNLIERGHESWKSYFSKWEVFAKFEEDISESDLFRESEKFIKLRGVKNKKPISQAKKRRSQLLLKNKRNQWNKKKIMKKKQITLKSLAHANSEHCTDSSKKHAVDKFTEFEMLETNLKIFLKDYLKEKSNKFEVFGILSLMFSGSQESNFHDLFLNYQNASNSHDLHLNKGALSCINQQNVFSKIPKLTANPVKNTYMQNINKVMNSPKFYSQPVVETRNLNWSSNHALADRYFRFEVYFKNELNESYIDPLSKITTEINFGSKRSYSSLLKSSHLESSELKSLDWNFSHKSPASLCRKINKEYFIKRIFPKMNIIQDGKRFRNLCLHKRTNSVSLSMENSNFTTPERKPPERKCFSENVLQRKRRCPSKLFFVNEEDSESDDQTENLTPLIHCTNKKLKTQTVTQGLESDVDEYESIFDRVKKC